MRRHRRLPLLQRPCGPSLARPTSPSPAILCRHGRCCRRLPRTIKVANTTCMQRQLPPMACLDTRRYVHPTSDVPRLSSRLSLLVDCRRSSSIFADYHRFSSIIVVSPHIAVYTGIFAFCMSYKPRSRLLLLLSLVAMRRSRLIVSTHSHLLVPDEPWRCRAAADLRAFSTTHSVGASYMSNKLRCSLKMEFILAF